MITCVLVACGDDASVLENPLSIRVASYAAAPSPGLDVLVQMDDSSGMLDVQEKLAAHLSVLLDGFAALPGGPPELHLGVVTSDLGTTGSLDRTTPGPSLDGCSGAGKDGALQTGGAQVTGHFVVDEADENGGRRGNYTGQLVDVVSQMIKTGGAGCGFEQHLAATQRAFENPLNDGFARPDANLLLLVVANEDDCSVTDPALFGPASAALGALQSYRCTRFGVTCDESLDTPGVKTNCLPEETSPYVDGVASYVDFFRRLRGDSAHLAVGMLIGPPVVDVVLRAPVGGTQPEIALSSSCTGFGPELADPGVRLAAFGTALAPNSEVQSMCSPDLAPQLASIGRLVKRMYGVVCLDTSVLGDGDSAPGVQPACTVTLDRASTQTALPACSASVTTDCFEVIPDAAACPETADHARLAVHLAAPDAETYVRASCLAPQPE